MKRFLLIIPFVKMAMLIGLVGFYLFWYLPSMWRIEHRRKQVQQHFDAAQECYVQSERMGDYSAAIKCEQDYLDWWVAND